MACDIRTGNAAVLDDGNLTMAMRSSMAIPGMFKPVRRDSLLMLDGGLVNNLPVDVARAMGADYVIAIAYVKLAAVQTNHTLGLIDDKIAGAISQACREIINGKFHDNFPTNMVQGGAGTSVNMNANEVIANRALEIMGHKNIETTLDIYTEVNFNKKQESLEELANKIDFF